MSMSIPEARAEIASHYQKAHEIESKYPEGLTPDVNTEDYEEVKRLLSEVDGLEAKLEGLEDAAQRARRISENVNRYREPVERMQHAGSQDDAAREWKSPGQQFTENADYQRILGSGILKSPNTIVAGLIQVAMAEGHSLLDARKMVAAMEQKAILGSSAAGAFVQNDLQPGFINILQRELTILDLIARSRTDSDTIEYVREDTYTNSAAMTAEATATTGTSGTKPESTLAYSAQTAPVKTLAHWIPVTNRMLADAPAMRGIIDQRLLLGLDLALETQIISGDGTGENFTGILNTTNIGIEDQTGLNNAMDALYSGRTMVRVDGKARPNAYVLHPNDWQAIRLARENAASATLGGYLMGPPSALGATTLWGLPVIESEGITENTGLVGDFQMGATLFDRESAVIRVGLINDQFVRNMQTVLAELRAAFVVWRPRAFTKVTGI